MAEHKRQEYMESFRVAAGWFPSSLQFIPRPRAICLTLPNHAIVLPPHYIKEWEMATHSITTSQINFIENVLGVSKTEGSDNRREEARGEETVYQDLLLSATKY